MKIHHTDSGDYLSQVESDSELSVVIANQYFMPDTSSTGYLLSQLASTLANQGIRVRVITCQPSYGPLETRQTCPRNGTMDGAQVHRLPTIRTGKDYLIGRALAGLSFVGLLFVWQLIHSSPRDVYLYCTNPPILPFVGALVSMFRRHRYVFLLHDAYPHIACLIGKMKRGSWLERLWHRANTWSLRRAQSVIVLCEKSKELLVKDYQIPEKKIFVVPNWADEKTISPVSKDLTLFAREHQLIGPFTLMYSGNLGLYYDFDTVLDAAETLQGENFRLVLIGAGGKRNDLAAEIKRRGLSNTSIYPHQPVERINDSLNSCDASLVTIAAGVEGISFPSKFYTSLAVGKPIIAISEEDSELRKLVEFHQCGIWSPLGHPMRLVRDLRRLMNDANSQAAMGAAARALFLRSYTRETSGAAYAQILRNATGD